MIAEERCPSCGALVAADAEWCSQCYEPLRPAAPTERAPPQSAAPSGAGAHEPPSATQPTVRAAGAQDPHAAGTVDPAGDRPLDVVEGRPAWVCPACGSRNPMEATACSACGTPFGALFEERREPPPAVEPGRAVAWSLLLPGLGHWILGRRADAVARFVLFAWVFGTLALVVSSRVGRGLGPVVPLVAVFSIASVALYALSAVDARRIAVGDAPLVSSRALLWASAALVLLSVLLATIGTFPARS